MTTIPTDPLLGAQWHLVNPIAGEIDINILEAWGDYSGAGVQVAVLDDGFDAGHADLAANYVETVDYNAIAGESDPQPDGAENHGTAVMGIVGAVGGNGTGGAGVAFGASLVGYRGLSLATIDNAIRDAAGIENGLPGAASGSDVMNMSFGFGANVFVAGSAINNVINALEEGTGSGRGGLGTVYVKSSGNSRALNGETGREEGTADAMDSTSFTINVAATRADGWVTDYSTPGANVLISAPVDDVFNSASITTVDRTGLFGYSTTDYVSDFGGTSAAAPQVTGAVALMLEANPLLGWRDVQKILAMTARHVGSEIGSVVNSGAPAGAGFEQATQPDASSWFLNGATGWNGGGMHFSNDYGFGLLDVSAAVRLAESWQLQSVSDNRASATYDLVGAPVIVPDGNAAGMVFAIDQVSGILVEHVELELAFSTTFLADMEIFLTAPDGTRVQMIADTGGSASFGGRWSFGTPAFMGTEGDGEWQVRVVDDTANDTLRIDDLKLTLFGAADRGDDLFVLTDAYAELVAAGGRETRFAGGAGTDAFNAAAATAAQEIDLAAGTGEIAGVSVALSSVEEVFTGSGDDRLTGSATSTRLWSGRGDDIVFGGLLGEDIHAGSGADTIDGGGGADLIDAGAGADVILISAADLAAGEELNGGEGIDALILDGGDALIDFTAAELLSIERLIFGEPLIVGERVAHFDGAEIDAPGELSPVLSVEGAAGAVAAQAVSIAMSVTSTLDISGWSFVDWDMSRDRVVIAGDASNESIRASAAADTIAGGAGNDAIFGGDGADRIEGGAGRDTVDAGAGDDLIVDGIAPDSSEADVYEGGAGVDTLEDIQAWTALAVFDLSRGEQIVAGAVRDLYSGIENLTVSGGAGLIGDEGANVLRITAAHASSGNTIEGRGGDDTILAAAGDDSLDGGDGADEIDGGDGNDRLRGGGGDDRLLGGAGDDTVNAGNGDDFLWDLMGANTLRGQGGNDSITAGAGRDEAFGGIGNDSIDAGDGNDLVLGQGDADTIAGGAGRDELRGGSGGDHLYGGTGDDLLFGQGNNDRLFGGDGADRLIGAAGADTLFGGEGNDSLFGGTARDRIEGGAGDDLMNGGAQPDSFIFEPGHGADTISGFEDDIDTIEFSSLLVGGLTSGAAVMSAFATVSGASVQFDFGNGDRLLVTNFAFDLLADDILVV